MKKEVVSVQCLLLEGVDPDVIRDMARGKKGECSFWANSPKTKKKCEISIALHRGLLLISRVPSEYGRVRSLLSSILGSFSDEQVEKTNLSVGAGRSDCGSINGYFVLVLIEGKSFLVTVHERHHLFDDFFKPLRDLCPEKGEEVASLR